MRELYRLHEAERVFGEAHGREQDLSETLRDAFVVGNEEEIRDFDATLLDRLAKGLVASANAASLARADAELNRAYQQALKTQIQKPTRYDPNPDPSEKDVREAQRAWIAYRDAWKALARARSPAATDGVTLEVIGERTRQIRAIGAE